MGVHVLYETLVCHFTSDEGSTIMAIINVFGNRHTPEKHKLKHAVHICHVSQVVGCDFTNDSLLVV